MMFTLVTLHCPGFFDTLQLQGDLRMFPALRALKLIVLRERESLESRRIGTSPQRRRVDDLMGAIRSGDRVVISRVSPFDRPFDRIVVTKTPFLEAPSFRAGRKERSAL